MTSAAELQPQAWRRLLACRERVPHALLVHGPQGIGKLELAALFAQLLLCEQPQSAMPCAQCGSCRWFVAGNHPDVRFVEPEALARHTPAGGEEPEKPKGKPSAEIKIDQIRALEDFVHIGSHRGGLRVAIVNPAEAMNPHASNALLKNLEEPPPGAVFLLASDRPARLLPTVRSRCVQIAVSLPQPAAAKAWLEGHGVRDSGKRLAFAGGAPRQALEDGAGERAAFIDEALAALASGEPAAVPLPRDREGLELLAEVLQKRAYDGVFAAFGLVSKYRTVAAAKPGPAREWIAYARKLGHDRMLARHPLNAMLHASQMLNAWPHS
jgi:DNA polymerase-3 subunit delta'